MKIFRKKTRAEWRQLIGDWKESGLRVEEFCRQRGVTSGRFYSWRKRFGLGSKSGGRLLKRRREIKQPQVKFLPVQVKELAVNDVNRGSAAQQRIEIFLGNGTVVRISGELSDDNLSRLMTLAAGTSC